MKNTPLPLAGGEYQPISFGGKYEKGKDKKKKKLE
jgi:hypothetical protein